MAIHSGSNASPVLSDAYTVATLPSAAEYARKYAWTTDLFGGPGDYCISDGVSWKPVRPLALSIVSNSNTDMTLTPLLSAPTQVLQGTLSATRTITMATTYGYSGARFRVKREAGGGLFNLNILGSLLGLNSWADFEFDGSTWKQTASGGLL